MDNDETKQEPVPQASGGQSQNEGEGNKSADERYRKGATGFAKQGGTLEKGLQGAREVDASPDEYKQAEQRGRAPAKGAEDLPDDVSGADFDKR